MAATVLRGKLGSGSSNGTTNYTNNTGGNVRLIINYADSISSSASISLSWGGGPFVTTENLANITETNVKAFGKNVSVASDLQNISVFSTNSSPQSLPVEIYLQPTDTFSITCNNYNIVVIPEAG
jgi:hypothetical protein